MLAVRNTSGPIRASRSGMPEVICTRPGCMKPIVDPVEAREKTYLVVTSGQVIALRRHDACESYGDALRRIDSDEVRKINSPAMAMRRMLEFRRSSRSRRPEKTGSFIKVRKS